MSSVRPSSSPNVTGPSLAAIPSAVWLLTRPSPPIVASPADAVAGTELDALGPVDLGAAPAPDSAGFQCTRPTSLPSSSTARLPWSTPMTRRSSFFSTPSRR